MLEVPITITYRLESDHSIIEREEGIQPLEVDERLIGMLDESARRASVPREKIVSDLLIAALIREPLERSPLYLESAGVCSAAGWFTALCSGQ